MLLAVAAPAWAQFANCAPREVFLSRLAEIYDETPVSLGVTSRGELIEVFAAPSGSWTLLITLPGGPTCMLVFGEGWRTLEPEPDEPLT